jgi:hypothetical protein
MLAEQQHGFSLPRMLFSDSTTQLCGAGEPRQRAADAAAAATAVAVRAALPQTLCVKELCVILEDGRGDWASTLAALHALHKHTSLHLGKLVLELFVVYVTMSGGGSSSSSGSYSAAAPPYGAVV